MNNIIHIANIGDEVIVNIDGIKTGVISMISKKGINIDNENGTTFVKWSNVKSLCKKHWQSMIVVE